MAIFFVYTYKSFMHLNTPTLAFESPIVAVTIPQQIADDMRDIASQAWMALRDQQGAELQAVDSRTTIPSTEEWIALRERHRRQIHNFERVFGY
jgi:hypothetical protein